MKMKIFIFVVCIFITGCSDIPVPKKGTNADNSSPAKSNIDESKKIGNRITSALAAYRADHLAFPGNLSLLVPKYIPEIDPPLSGNKSWIYKTYEDSQRYKLSFKTSTLGTSECYFDSKDNHWICD